MTDHDLKRVIKGLESPELSWSEKGFLAYYLLVDGAKLGDATDRIKARYEDEPCFQCDMSSTVDIIFPFLEGEE